MFTGIIEQTATVVTATPKGTGLVLELEAALAPELRPEESVAHDGVCLTITHKAGTRYRVTAVEETLSRTALAHWSPGRRINLERALRVGDRLDGHLVQGHVDALGHVYQIDDRQGSWLMTFTYPAVHAPLMIEKGSITVNGVSLTCFDLRPGPAVGLPDDVALFSVAVIPFTWERTALSALSPGDPIHLEFDVMGKYLARWRTLPDTGLGR